MLTGSYSLRAIPPSSKTGRGRPDNQQAWRCVGDSGSGSRCGIGLAGVAMAVVGLAFVASAERIADYRSSRPLGVRGEVESPWLAGGPFGAGRTARWLVEEGTLEADWGSCSRWCRSALGTLAVGVLDIYYNGRNISMGA